MAFTTKNTGVLATTNTVLTGIRAYFRKGGRGQTGSAKNFTNLGNITGYNRTQNTSKAEIKTKWNAITTTLKSVVSEITKSFTITSASILDAEVQKVFYGGDAGAGASSPTNLSTVKVASDTGVSNTGDMILDLPTDTGDFVVIYFPSVSLQGTNEPDDNGYKVFEFTADVLLDSTFSLPAQLGTLSNTSTPFAYVFTVPAAQHDAVLDALWGLS